LTLSLRVVGLIAVATLQGVLPNPVLDHISLVCLSDRPASSREIYFNFDPDSPSPPRPLIRCMLYLFLTLRLMLSVILALTSILALPHAYSDPDHVICSLVC